MVKRNVVLEQSTLEKAVMDSNGFHVNGADGITENDLIDLEQGFDGLLVSEELYWEHYYSYPETSYEWNDGRLEAKPMSDYASFRVYLWFLNVLNDYLCAYANARVIGLEMGFRMKLRKKTTIRKPDLGVVLNSNPIPLGDHDQSYKGIFDICIESVSHSRKGEVERDTVTKKLEYAEAGVREYYIIDERKKETQFFYLSDNNVYVPIPRIQGVVHSMILPGFQLRVTDLYRQPTPPEMLNDPIYRGFVSPYLRQERLRAEQAEIKAEQAEIQAAYYAGLLRNAGLLPVESTK